jgi:glycosyltransferase involved in cell wall biosynthesis
MKVILTAYGASGYSGLPKYFYFLAKHLALSGIATELIVDSPDRVDKMREVNQLTKATVISPPVTGMLSKALFSLNVAKYLAKQDFDILHSCDVIPYFYLMLKSRKPVVFQPFSSELFQLGDNDIRRMFYFVLRSCGQRSEALAVVGEWQREQTIQDYKVSRDKTFVLPVCIDIDFVRELAGKREDIRARLGIPQDKFVVLSVNILLPCKDISSLIQAMVGVSDAMLVVVSDGPEADSLHRQSTELGLQDRVIFTGKVPEKELYDYYAMADVFVSPTLLDGSSMGIMEAEVFGLPIVSTHQEFLINGNGYIVPEKSPSAIAEAIQKVRKGDRAAMGAQSREIVKQFDFKMIAKDAIAKYEELLR